jgi:ADP-ribose pyrophosphatase YjhB (NUDIX family)
MIPAPPTYCQVCGNALADRYLEDEGRNRLVCDACGHIHYLNPTVVAGVIPVSDGRVWLLRRAIEPRVGYWTYPAGYMELGETVEDAAARETREELNMEVRLLRLLNVYSWPHLRTVHVIYIAEALTPGSNGVEALECRLFLPGGIPWDELAFNTTHAALTDWLHGRERLPRQAELPEVH